MPKITYEAKDFTASTLATIGQAGAIITEYEEQGFRLTLRGLYYKLVVRNLIRNTDREYKRLGGIISDARRAGLIDWQSIEDITRNLRSNSAWDSALDMMKTAHDLYHQDLWATQPVRFEVWIEKDALVGFIAEVCQQLDVPYFSCRGYVSDSAMWQAAIRVRRHNEAGQRVIMLHLGDHDPSGIDMTRDIRDRIDMLSLRGNFEVDHIALSMAQVDEQGPPPNPAKVTDSRYEGYVATYGDDSWELDALEPAFIVGLIEEAVLPERDPAAWDEAVDEQEAERAQLQDIIDRWDEITGGKDES